MARVPVATQESDLRALPNARQESIASAKLFEGQGSENIAMGQGLQRAGAQVADIAMKMQDRENADMLFRAETAYKDDLLKITTDAQQRRGANAFNVTTDVDTQLTESAKKHSEGLTNEVQRRLFSEQVTKSQQQTRGSMSRFEWEQRRESVIESTQAAVGSTIKLAAAAAADGYIKAPSETAEGINTFRQDIKKHIAVLGQIEGWLPSKRQYEEAKFVSMMHEQVIQNMVDKDPKAAKAYYAENKGEIGGDKRDNIDKLLKAGTSTLIGQEIRDVVVAKGMTEDQALAFVREKYEGEDEKNGRAAVVEYFGDMSRASQRKQLNAGDEAWRIFNERGSINAIPATVRNDMDPKAWASLREHAENKAKGVSTKTDITVWAEVRDKIERGEITDTKSLLNYRGKLSDGDIKAFTTLLSKPEKVLQARIDTEDFNSVADQAGLKPFDPTKNEVQRRGLNEMKQKVEALIDLEQANKKRELTRVEKMELMRTEINNRVIVGGGLFGSVWTDGAKPVVALTEDERKRVVVPKSYQTDAIAARKKQGLPTDDALIRELWLRTPESDRKKYK